jgi:Tol biopolymer transport system component
MFRKFLLAVLLVFVAVSANAQMVPYFGKNNVKYDTFDWKTYKTAHFEIFFYPQSEKHLERVASMAESAYDKISADLQHDIEFKIPLIFFKTQSEFEQVNYLQISEGILGAAEPVYNRMAFAIDQPSDKLQELIMHELTHVFEFSMLFGGMISPVLKQSPPLWVMEGFAEYETGVWDPADRMIVRDAVMTERLPFLSVREDLIAPGGIELGRAPYNVGHAAFEFMRDKYGEAAVRQFWFYLKKATLLGTEDVIYSALGVKEETFNEQFAEYLRKLFEEYRDRQSPVDYGHEVGVPAKYAQIFSQAPSPDGSQFVVLTANREDYEFDILKIDATGKVLDNLTGGFSNAYDYLTTDSYTFEGRNLSWSANGQRIAFFARTGKRRSLIVVDAKDGDRLKKIKLKIDMAGSPALSPDGKTVLITGLVNGQPDLFEIDVDRESIKNLTNNILYEKTPVWSPDGKWIFYTSRIRSRDQILKMEVANPTHIEQLTFSEYDSVSPYYDQKTNSLYYSADKNGVFNLYRLDLNTGDKIQYTDVIGGNFSPASVHIEGKDRIAFTSFFKGQYRFFLMDLPTPVAMIPKGTETNEGDTKTTSEQLALTFGIKDQQQEAQGNASTESDFRPTKQLAIDSGKVADKKFRMLIAGRPSVITGVSGDTFAVASGVVLQDILGDQEFRFFTSRIRGFQSYNVGYLDLRHRYQYLSDFIFNDDFFIAPLPAQVASAVGFGDDVVRSRIWGGRVVSQYPFSRFYRAEFSAGIFDLNQEFYDPNVQALYEAHLRRTGQQDILAHGGYVPIGLALVGETTRFREFGPLSGFTFRLSLDYAPELRDDWVSRTIVELDMRKYFRVHGRSVLAMRGRAFRTTGKDPVIFSFGGGQDVRGFDYREIIGTEGGIGNLEFRFPLYPNPRVPFLGQMRGKVFVDYFRASFPNGSETDFALPEDNLILREVDGLPFLLDAEEGSGSIGFGFTVFAGGLPFNFDFSRVYGHGRKVLNPFPVVLGPAEDTFVDGLKFDFSIAYDF